MNSIPGEVILYLDTFLLITFYGQLLSFSFAHLVQFKIKYYEETIIKETKVTKQLRALGTSRANQIRIGNVEFFFELVGIFKGIVGNNNDVKQFLSLAAPSPAD